MVKTARQKAVIETSLNNNNNSNDHEVNETFQDNEAGLAAASYPLRSNGGGRGDCKHLASGDSDRVESLAPGSVSASDEFITVSMRPTGNERLTIHNVEVDDSNKIEHITSRPSAEQAAINSSTTNTKPIPTSIVIHKCTSFQQQQQQKLKQKPDWVSTTALSSSASPTKSNNNDELACQDNNNSSLTKNSLESINSKQSDTSVLISSDLSLASSSADMAINESNHKTSTFKHNKSNTTQSSPGRANNNNDHDHELDKDDNYLNRDRNCVIKSKHQNVECKLNMENVLDPNLLQASNVGSDFLSAENGKSPFGNLSDQVRFSDHANPKSNSLNPADQNQNNNNVKFKPGPAGDGRRPSSAAMRRASMCHAKPPFPFAGIFAALLSSVFFSLSALMIKLLPDSDEGEGLQEKLKAMLTRGSIITIICAITICLTGSTFKVKRDEIWVNFARAIIGSMAVMSLFCSLEYISLGDATALMFSSPIWTYLLSHFIFAEPLHWILVFLLPLGVVGIILISHPTLIVPISHLSLNHPDSNFIEQGTSIAAAALAETPMQIPATPLLQTNDSLNLISSLLYNETASVASGDIALLADQLEQSETVADHLSERWPGIAISLAGSVFVSLTYIVLKFRKSTPIQTTTFWFGLGQMSVSMIAMCFIGFGQVPKSYLEWTLLIANGVLSWLGQCVLQWSFAYEDAGVLSIVRTADVAVCFLLSALFLEDDIYWTSIVGSLILGLVVALIIVNNWIYKSCHPNPDAHLIYAYDSSITPTKTRTSEHENEREHTKS